MWNLTGDDVLRAIEELKGRRAAIQARYDSEMKQLEADLSDLDAFERLAVKIAADYVGEATPSAIAADPSPVVENAAARSGENSAPPLQAPAESSAEPNAESEPAAGAEPAGAPKGSSRWRMRLGAGEGSR